MPKLVGVRSITLSPWHTMRTSFLLSALACLLVVLSMAGCTPAGQPTSADTPSTPAAAAPMLPATSPQAATEVVTVTAGAVVTTTVTPPMLPVDLTIITDSAHLTTTTVTVLTNLNIRGGPGLTHPVVGWLLAGARPQVIGVSEDGEWLQIVCPEGLDVAVCWVTRSPDVVGPEEVAAAAAAAPTRTAVPTPRPMPTTRSCTPTSPAGWGAYRVAAGDTLYELAEQTGVSVADLQAANCLDSDVILEGAPLHVPSIPAAVAPPAESWKGKVLDIADVKSIAASGRPKQYRMP